MPQYSHGEYDSDEHDAILTVEYDSDKHTTQSSQGNTTVINMT